MIRLLFIKDHCAFLRLQLVDGRIKERRDGLLPKLGPVLVAGLEELAATEEKDSSYRRPDNLAGVLRLHSSRIPLLDKIKFSPRSDRLL